MSPERYVCAHRTHESKRARASEQEMKGAHTQGSGGERGRARERKGEGGRRGKGLQDERGREGGRGKRGRKREDEGGREDANGHGITETV